MPDPSLLQGLKERKLVQWALAYLAGAFVVFQLLDALAEPLGLRLLPTLMASMNLGSPSCVGYSKVAFPEVASRKNRIVPCRPLLS